MRVANKLTPEPKKRLSLDMDQEKFKSRPSSSLFQIARGSRATLKTLEITKSVKTTENTEVCQDNSQHRVVYATPTGARQAFNRLRKFVKTTDCTELFTW